MKYQVLVLDLDGTLTNSSKEITPATKAALIDIQRKGIRIVLASGRPDCGIAPLAKELELSRHGGYILSFNGARITDCSTGEFIYNRTLPLELVRPLYELLLPYKNRGIDIISYEPYRFLSGIQVTPYSKKESAINKYPIEFVEDFPSQIKEPVNKLLITGDPELMEEVMEKLTGIYHSALSIYRSEPYFLEIMPQNIDKAHSLQKLLNSLGISEDKMICCGDGFNDITMIEYAGLGVAMANAQPELLEKADFVTKSNDEDGILHVIRQFLQD